MSSKEPPYLVFPPDEWDVVHRIAAALLAGARPGHVHDDGTVEGCPGCFWEPAPVPHRPCRGDDVEAWLKQWRDQFGHPSSYPERTAIDNLLDDYRLRADTGTPLHAEVRERDEP